MTISASRILPCSVIGCALTSLGALQVDVPRPGAAYPGSGKIRQLNYGVDGAVNGFVLDNGTLAIFPPFRTTNPPSIRVGASVRYSGYTRKATNGLTIVDVQALTANGQTINMDTARPPLPPPPNTEPAPRRGVDQAPSPPSPPPPPAGPRQR
jgi:hypothetical protein